jgi:hypothetical protein
LPSFWIPLPGYIDRTQSLILNFDGLITSRV